MLIVVGFTLVFSGTVSAGIIEVPPMGSLYNTSAAITVGDDGVTFDIDRNANILLKLKGVAEISFDYRSDGYFRLEYLTSPISTHKIYPKFLMGLSLLKGEGHLRLNLRRTVNWSPDTYPLLMFIGTGRFTIKNLKAETVTAASSYESDKNSAFFWRPETLRSSMMNFITPVYWNFTKKSKWPNVLGGVYIIVVAAILLTGFFQKTSLTRFIPKLSLFFMLIFGLHFAIRFQPMIHWGFYLPASEKIRKYTPLPELGQFVADAKEILKPGDKVLVIGDKRDWFSPKVICFNIAPVNCAIYDPRGWSRVGSIKSRGMEIIRNIKSSDANVIIYYNFSDQILHSFGEKIYELNKNIFIVKKK